MGRAMGAVAGLGSALLLVAACDTVDVGDPPADVNACRPSQQFFYERVWPEFLGKDNGGRRCSDSRCHDASSPRVLVLPPPQSAPGLPLPTDWAGVYKAAAEQMLCTNVGESPLIVRPSQPGHGGGALIDLAGPEAAVVRAWVEAP
ncbi:MAG TPA: hypothetical protein VGG33_11100 [Polyangia bacterium]